MVFTVYAMMSWHVKKFAEDNRGILRDFCLSHLFTAIPFDDGVMGYASSPAICSESKTILNLSDLYFLNNNYRIYSRISRPAYKPTPIPTAENVAKISDSRISQLRKLAPNEYPGSVG